MDHARFDQIARAMSHAIPRRTLAGILSLGVLGLAVGSQGGDARKRHLNAACVVCSGCPQGTACVDPVSSSCPLDASSSPGEWKEHHDTARDRWEPGADFRHAHG
jgi:hypothetical protein